MRPNSSMKTRQEDRSEEAEKGLRGLEREMVEAKQEITEIKSGMLRMEERLERIEKLMKEMIEERRELTESLQIVLKTRGRVEIVEKAEVSQEEGDRRREDMTRIKEGMRDKEEGRNNERKETEEGAKEKVGRERNVEERRRDLEESAVRDWWEEISSEEEGRMEERKYVARRRERKESDDTEKSEVMRDPADVSKRREAEVKRWIEEESLRRTQGRWEWNSSTGCERNRQEGDAVSEGGEEIRRRKKEEEGDAERFSVWRKVENREEQVRKRRERAEREKRVREDKKEREKDERRRRSLLWKRVVGECQRERREAVELIIERLLRRPVPIRKVAEAPGEGKGRVIFMELEKEGDKEEIMRRNEEIWRKWEVGVDEYLTMEERAHRHRMVKMAREERLKGRNVVMTNGKIWIDGREVKWDEEENRWRKA